MNGQDFRSFDWDDTALVRAYIRGFEARKAKKENKNGSNKDNRKRKWHIGDYCKASYSDGLYYEAKIVSLNGDFCTVEFLGYEENGDVDLLLLKESEGKKARRKQIKECLDEETADGSSSIVESEAAGNTTDATVVSHRQSYKKKNSHVNQSVNNTTFDTTTYEAAYHQQYSAAAPAPAPAPPVAYYYPPMPTTNLPFMPPPAAVPQFSAPAPPPMPQCPSVANNPAFASMLTSWYMAGYYTGINSVQKENRGCQRCCSHSNNCCRN